MIAPTADPVKLDKRFLVDWMTQHGFQLIRKQWVGKTHCAQVTPLLNNRVLIQVGLPV